MYQSGDRYAMFEPLIKAIALDKSATPPEIDDWMFMGTQKVKSYDGMGGSELFLWLELADYKHRDSRLCVHIDDDGQCWMQNSGSPWIRVTNGIAFDRATEMVRA